MLADAFHDYPWTRWTVDPRDHRARVRELQRLAIEHVGLPYGEVWIAGTSDTIAAVAVWTDSRRPPPERAWAEIADRQRSLEGDRHAASRAAQEATGSLQPAMSHLYLAAVGTLTGAQGQGFGYAVLEPVLAAADDDRIHSFLETSSEANLRFYGRLGFAISGEVHIQDGPPVWGMLRPPAPPRTQ